MLFHLRFLDQQFRHFHFQVLQCFLHLIHLYEPHMQDYIFQFQLHRQMQLLKDLNLLQNHFQGHFHLQVLNHLLHQLLL